MPFNVNVSALSPGSRRFAVSPNQTGGYTRDTRQNPNSGMATYQRNQQPTTQPTQGPLLPPNVASQDPLGTRLQLAGVKASQDSAYERSKDAASRGVATINTVLPDPKWAGLMQALFESGAENVKARGSGWGTPGFFAQQDPNNLQRKALVEQLQAQDLNNYGRVR